MALEGRACCVGAFEMVLAFDTDDPGWIVLFRDMRRGIGSGRASVCCGFVLLIGDFAGGALTMLG